MNEWTVERLDALPDNTLIEYGGEILHSTNGRWRDPAGIEWTSGELIDLSGSTNVRVVSVPVDALLTRETCLAANVVPMHTERGMTYETLRLAIAHVTGEDRNG